MELWRNAKLRTKVGTGLLVATVGLAGFAVTLVVGKQGDLGAAEQVVTVTTLSTKVGNLLHETQRERGRTAQFTSSRGAKFGPELAAQQKVTDQRLADYRGFLAAHRDLPGDLRAAVDRLDGALDTLAGLRSQAAALPASPATVIGGYTSLNRSLLATIAAAAAQNRNPTIGVRLQAYLALLSAKEDTGLERAQLTGVFTADRFAAGQFATVLSLMASQKAYLTVFERAAGADVLKRWAEIRDSAVFKQVADLEQVAVNRAASGQFGVDSGVWFDAVTQKIDLYKQLEDLQAAGILALARGAGSEASAGAVTALVAAVVLLLVTVLIGIAVIVSITRPLKQVTTVAEQIAVGDVSGVVSYRSRDEVGQLADSFRRLGSYVRESAEQALALSTGDLRVEVKPRGENDLLGNAMWATVDRLRSMVGEIQESGRRLSVSARQLTDSNGDLVVSSRQTADQAMSVSAASDEMIASIGEISRGTGQAADVAQDAVATAARASQVITTLSEASGDITNVVNLIQAIAAQTNLLALNATIEASRAGDAGRGFGVVADEVKRLAQRTAEATVAITEKVTGIQQGATAAGDAIGRIGDIVGRVSEIATTIAGAVEEQTATTNEISRSVAEVAGAAAVTTRVTAASAESATELSMMAGNLHSLVAQFTVDR